MKKLLQLKTMLLLCALIVGSGSAWADEVTLSSTQIKAGTGNTSYGACSATDNKGNTWNAYAIKNQHSNATSDYHFWQIKKYTSGVAYYVQVPTLGKITKLVITVSSASKARDGGSNTATLYFSSSNSTSSTGSGVVSGTGASEITLDCSSLNLNTGYITASGALRIWDIVATYEIPCSTPTFSEVSGSKLTKGTNVTISTSTDGSTIYYTTDGSTPTTSSAHGTEETASATVTVNDDMTIKAIAVKDGNSNSEVAEASYTVTKAANDITVTGGTTQSIVLKGTGAIDGGLFDLRELVSATYGTPEYAIKSTTNLVEGTDFDFADGLFEFKTTYKGIVVVTASVAPTSDYEGDEKDITINCSGDLRNPDYAFEDVEELFRKSTITVASGENVETDGTITLSTTDADIASVNNDTKVITGVGIGSCDITVNTAEGTYYAAGSKIFTLNVRAEKGSAENPFTVAEAIDAIDAVEKTTINDVYVKGIVCSGGSTYYNSSKLNYWISDDGTTTNMFEIYRGKGLDGAAFSGTSDIQVGDIVTVNGNITYFSMSGNYVFAEDSKIASFKRKAESDLDITSSNPLALEMTTSTIHPTSTITWSTSSTGAVACTSSDNAVATVTNAGVITVQGPGSATITISQEADDDYKVGEQTVTVTVTDNRTVVATGIDLTQKVFTKEDLGEFAATSTKADGFTGTITYTYTTLNAAIMEVAGNTYSAEGVGTATITVTATPTEGNAENYKTTSQKVAVTVNGENSISLSPASEPVPFSAETFDITATVPTENYNGTVSAESSNTAVATVAVSGTTVTVTPVAVGSTTITVTAGAGTYYPETAQAEYAVTFTQPIGSSTKPSADPITLFEETFAGCKSTGGNDGSWSGTIATIDASGSSFDVSGWTYSSAKEANACLKAGITGGGGSATTPGIDLESDKVYTLTFRAAAWNGNDEKTTLSLSAENATIRNETNDANVSSVTMTKGAWTTYTLKLINGSDGATVRFYTSSKNNRFFLDDVKVVEPVTPITKTSVTIASSGYGSYCYDYPLTMPNTADCKAYIVTAANKDAVTFTQIEGDIMGGVPFILYGKPGSYDIELPASSTTEPENNKLEGTLAPTYVATVEGDYTNFGLSGGSFKKITSGVVHANKAYLPVLTSALSGSSDGRLSIVFEEEETGIKSMRDSGKFLDNTVYNLSGQRVENPTKGLYIVNGRKVVVK